MKSFPPNALGCRRLLLAARALVVLVVCPPMTAAAQDDLPVGTENVDLATRWRVNDADPGATIPSEAERNEDPLEFGYWLQDMLARAEGARELRDWQSVIKYYEPLRKALPEQITSYQRLCEAHQKLGQTPEAIERCTDVLSRKGAVVQDHLRLLDTLTGQSSLTSEQITAVKASLDHLREHAKLNPQPLPGDGQPRPERADDMSPEERKADPKKWARLKTAEILGKAAGEPAAGSAVDAMHLPTQIEIFSCRLGVRTGDAARLAECTDRLTSYRFPSKLIVPFSWAQALAERDEPEANQVLAAAKQEGVPDSALQAMRTEQARIFAAQGEGKDGDTTANLAARPGFGLLIPLGVALALAAVFAFVMIRRARSNGSPS